MKTWDGVAPGVVANDVEKTKTTLVTSVRKTVSSHGIGRWLNFQTR
jgi:hypothetical protein